MNRQGCYSIDQVWDYHGQNNLSMKCKEESKYKETKADTLNRHKCSVDYVWEVGQNIRKF